MKKIILLILMTLSALTAKGGEVLLPMFEVDVQYSKNAKEQLVERNEIITLVITVSTPSQSKLVYFRKWNYTPLVKQEIVVKESTLLKINNLMVDEKYKNELDNLIIIINAYSSPAPFESCQPEYQNNSYLKGDMKSLKNKKHLFEIKVKDDFVLKV